LLGATAAIPASAPVRNAAYSPEVIIPDDDAACISEDLIAGNGNRPAAAAQTGTAEISAEAEIPADPAAASIDDEMVRLSLAGDQDAFEVLVRRHSPRVFNIIGSFFRRRDMVEDIAQDVFVKSYLSLSSYTIGRSFEAWMAKIAVNSCYDHLRAQRRRAESFSQDPDHDEDWLELQMLEGAKSRHASEERRRDAAEIADRLLSKLPPEDRLVVVLMDRDGFSVREVADVTGWGPSKVKVRAFRARRTLRSAMKRLVVASERKQRRANEAGS
jgi:RNA polymerase sigma-70 factor (ECF subfamily)